MIVYVVELEMDDALRDEYLAWLGDHAHELLALPGFTGAEILVRSEPSPPHGRFVVQVHYRLRDRKAWDDYLADHAPRMREAGVARFGQRVRASRILLESPGRRRCRAVLHKRWLPRTRRGSPPQIAPRNPRIRHICMNIKEKHA